MKVFELCGKKSLGTVYSINDTNAPERLSKKDTVKRIFEALGLANNDSYMKDDIDKIVKDIKDKNN